jgi:hypothetical protein
MHDWLEAERMISAKHLTIEALTIGVSAPERQAASHKMETSTGEKTAPSPIVPKKVDAKKALPKAASNKRKKA